MKKSEAYDLAATVVLILGMGLFLVGHISHDVFTVFLIGGTYLQVAANRERFKEL